MMKRFSILMSIMMAAAIVTIAQTTSVPPRQDGMKLEALEWTRQVVMGWNLGNSLECPGDETAWGNPVNTREMIHALRQSGFNAIRIPVRWGDHVTDTITMNVQPVWMARVKEIVDWCLDEGMFVVINDHHEAWYDRHPFYAVQAENNRRLAALWTCIATAFRDYGERLVFAGTNETTVDWAEPTAEQQDVQNSYNQTFVDAVRSTGGRNFYRNLVVQTYACSSYHGLKGFTIPVDKVENRLSVEVHYYDPFDYAGNGKYYYWGEAYRDKGDIVEYDTEKTQKALFDRLSDTWCSRGLGVVVGEYGVTNHYTETDSLTQQANMHYYLKTLVSQVRAHGFAAFAWDNNAFGNGKEQYGIFRRRDGMAIGNDYFFRGIADGASAPIP